MKSMPPISMGKQMLIVALMSSVAILTLEQVQNRAWAQGSGGGASQTMLDEIIVTSTRRATTVQEVPASVVAFSGVQIERQRIENTSDLIRLVPNALFSTYTKTTSYVSMRGLSSFEDAPGADLPVAFFVDDVYMNGIVSNHVNMFDLERIEVLRGPQGTLFGRNVVGGAVMLFSRRPSFDTEMKAQVGYGNYDAFEASGVIGGALIEDKLAGRVSFHTSRSDGSIYNETLDERLESKNLSNLHAQLLYRVNDNIDALISVKGMWDSGKSFNMKLLTLGDIALVDSLNISPDYFVNNHNYSPTFEQEIWTYMLRVDAETNWGTLTSISAYHTNDTWARRDTDALPIPIIEHPEFVDNKQFTQELRLATPADKRLSAVIGAFYLHANNERDEQHQYTLHPGTVLGTVLGTGLFDTSQLQHIKVDSIALFADATFHLTQDLSLQGGARWTRDKKSGFTNVTGTPNVINGAPVFSGDYSKSWTAVTPRGVIRYEIDDNRSIYASVSRGFKGGGYSTGVGTVVGLSTPFDPEFAWNYEAGFRSTWLDRRLLFNITGFWMDLKNLQTRSFSTAGVSVVGNAGEVRSKGIETELEVYPTGGMRLYANYGYTISKYVNATLAGVDISGNHVPMTPKHALAVGFNYEMPVNDQHFVRIGADVTRKSKYQANDRNNVHGEFLKLTRADFLLNGAVAFGPSDGNWEVSIWGKNLTNEAIAHGPIELTTFYASLAEMAAGARAAIANFAPPRTYGVTFTYQY